ncbi:hypothetical protein [Nitrosopumilus spindle-shaped virus]|uniref:Uncharacterized protein n=1 Tax=Nitrosopumilus spindle-shaped virus TaxID=2508184 RepID=A0A514K4L2_9VIRU|nr:hypothetical protein [Nitrosopumilus spindle-shaped virus]
MAKKHSKYTEISVKIDNKSILTEIREAAREEANNSTRWLSEKLSSLTKDLAQSQRDIASLKTKCNRLESQIKN